LIFAIFVFFVVKTNQVTGLENREKTYLNYSRHIIMFTAVLALSAQAGNNIVPPQSSNGLAPEVTEFSPKSFTVYDPKMVGE